AQAAAWGVFYNQGEVCTAASRLLVEAPIKDAFLARVIEVAKGMKVGDPLDPSTQFGAMVSERQMKTALDYIATADSQGARRVLGGARVRQETGGFYVEPTIFDQVRPDQTLAREEVFGPVLGVMTFSSEDEAMRLANDTVYGLAAGLWTGEVSKALRGARRLKAGLVWVNGWDACDITMPFGGFKQSGFGRDRSLHALHKYADLKSVSVTLR
ncbi:MAG: aldehyde dehydrogenase family protein, partial [Caulobacter sp.]